VKEAARRRWRTFWSAWRGDRPHRRGHPTDSRDDAVPPSAGASACRSSAEADRRARCVRWPGSAQSSCVTGDCPLIDPALVDDMVRLFLERPGAFDLVTNRHPLTFPDGLDFDVLPREALERAGREATLPHHREHTVPFFWETGLRVHNVVDPENHFRRHRWTLDYPDDYELIRRIFEGLHREGEHFGMRDILAFLEKNPQLSGLNAKYIPAG
jgi:spore coat polysaccharide biosynthesis protein SpsF